VNKISRTIVCFLFFLVASSCAHNNNLNYQKKILQRESFLKIEKSIIVESCLSEGECSKQRLGSSGSGAVVKTNFWGAYVLTAAHVCDDSDVIEHIKRDQPPNTKIKSSFTVITLDGQRLPVEIIDMDFKNDMCMLWVDNLFEPALTISPRHPVPGDKVFNMAAPLGVHSDNMVPIFSGYYNGIDKRNVAIYSIPAFGGSSGSPILNHRGELVGMIHSTLRYFPEIAISPNYKAMRAFINRTIETHAASRIVNVFLNAIIR